MTIIFNIILLRVRNISGKIVEKIKTLILPLKFFPENFAIL